MKRIQYGCLLALVGILFVLAVAMPTMLQYVGSRGDKNWENSISPRVASYPDYLYTISGLVPEGIAVNSSGYVYIVDTNNHRVAVFDNTNTYQYSIGELGVGGPENEHFYYPSFVAVNNTGYVYVSDTNNHRVQVFDNAGIYQYTIGQTSVPLDDNAHFYMPTGVAVNGSGHVYVADCWNHRVQVFDNGGVYQYTIGVAGEIGDDNNHFNRTFGVAVNSSGHVYVADAWNERVQVFDKAGIYQYSLGTAGEPLSDNAHYNHPIGIAVNATDYVYIVDNNNNRVQVLDPSGIYLYTIGVTGESGPGNDHFYWPTGVAVNATGHVYVADTDNLRVQVFGVPAPTGLAITINGGAAGTGSTSVTLALAATNATQMCFSNNGTTYTDWEAFGTSKTWVLEGGPGPKTVYFKARCDLSETTPITGTITYILPPTGLSVAINDGEEETITTRVTLTLSATGATQMCFSNDGVTWSGWEPFATSKVWIMGCEIGLQAVYFKARNGTIEASAMVTDTINYAPCSGNTNLTIAIAAVSAMAGAAAGAAIMKSLTKTPKTRSSD
jgi:hypothetical protein